VILLLVPCLAAAVALPLKRLQPTVTGLFVLNAKNNSSDSIVFQTAYTHWLTAVFHMNLV